MVTKTMVGIVCTTALTITGIIVLADPYILYVGFGLIATLCGVSLIKNGFVKK